ncbi:MAG: hypothetical protein HUJ97_02980 [Bacteroidales bacterium]|nr:hypothetical protein [Bacteroidales bacterium]
MVYLNENGSLDIERINSLPLEEHMKVIGSLTKEQYKEFLSSLPLNESREHTRAVEVNHTMDDLLRQGCSNLAELINDLRKNEFR